MNYLEVVKNFKDQDAAAANNKKVLVLHTHSNYYLISVLFSCTTPTYHPQIEDVVSSLNSTAVSAAAVFADVSAK